jgi:hypothetical protein
MLLHSSSGQQMLQNHQLTHKNSSLECCRQAFECHRATIKVQLQLHHPASFNRYQEHNCTTGSHYNRCSDYQQPQQHSTTQPASLKQQQHHHRTTMQLATMHSIYPPANTLPTWLQLTASFKEPRQLLCAGPTQRPPCPVFTSCNGSHHNYQYPQQHSSTAQHHLHASNSSSVTTAQQCSWPPATAASNHQPTPYRRSSY